MFWMQTLDGGKWLQDCVAELPRGKWPVAIWRRIPFAESVALCEGMEPPAGELGRLYRLVTDSLANDWPVYLEVAP
jgi:hypothetical protein